MRLGDEEVEFDQFTPRGQPYPKDSRSPDRWFQHFAIVVSDMDHAYAQLRQQHFASISQGGPQTLPPQTGAVRAFKFRDPDGHPLELLYFPQGQGRAVWHQPHTGDPIFLGIDHSAIGIASTERSLAFYTQLLGLKQAYQSLIEGPTQVALDGTFNATVRITGLRPPDADGPGVELLDYRAPADGRAASAQTHSNDLVHARLTFKVDDLEALSKNLFDAEVPFVSPRIVQLPGDGGRALLVRDPDGHAIELVQ
ncbi:MAG: Glyoxalase-like domain protein, partial [Nevskia sp.]|nr:Glyoxalase-like domain protein [Nevskia sp.]